MCNSGAGGPPPQVERGDDPRPQPLTRAGAGPGPSRSEGRREGSPGKAQDGAAGGPSPNVPPASSTGSGEQLGGGAEEGRARRQCPSPGPPSCPTGQITPHLHEGFPNPQPRGFQRPPACPWTLLLFCPCGGGAGPDRPRQAALSPEHQGTVRQASCPTRRPTRKQRRRAGTRPETQAGPTAPCAAPRWDWC